MTPEPVGRSRRPHPVHTLSLHWQNRGPDFAAGNYSRAHVWRFDGGCEVPASPSPHVVPAPWSDPAAVDPEEALLAAIAACHMLTFLWLASKAGFVVATYDDSPEAHLTKNEQRQPWVSRVVLRPRIRWEGETVPDAAQLADLHHRSHEQCFIANSVRCAIEIAAGPVE